jgi:hypothetical protein
MDTGGDVCTRNLGVLRWPGDTPCITQALLARVVKSVQFKTLQTHPGAEQQQQGNVWRRRNMEESILIGGRHKKTRRGLGPRRAVH